jgi:hypothetical protein
MRLNYSKYFLINDSKQLRETKFSNLSKSEKQRWIAYKNYMTKSPFMINFLHQKQQKLCPICQKPIELKKSVIHHLDYDYWCYFDGFFRIAKPILKRKKRTIRIAKCEVCIDRKGCLERVVLLDKKCHLALHIKDGRIEIKPHIANTNQINLPF